MERTHPRSTTRRFDLTGCGIADTPKTRTSSYRILRNMPTESVLVPRGLVSVRNLSSFASTIAVAAAGEIHVNRSYSQESRDRNPTTKDGRLACVGAL